jgi:hypothetical protein
MKWNKDYSSGLTVTQSNVKYIAYLILNMFKVLNVRKQFFKKFLSI